MTRPFQPMLAATIEESDLDNLDYPVIVQPKIDGIRCCILEGKALSRTLKPIPNRYIRNKLESMMQFFPYLIDGELIVGDNFQDTSSAVMSFEGEPDFNYVVFDLIHEHYQCPYYSRLGHIDDLPYFGFLNKLHGERADNSRQVLGIESRYLSSRFEGIIIRNQHSPYKFGRSTIKEQALLKLKRFRDAEAQVVGFLPMEKNDNELEFDERGYAKRSTQQHGMHVLPMLGALVVIGLNPPFENVEFNIGSGFTGNERKKIWDYQSKYIDRIVTFKYQPTGVKDKPRAPIFKAWREDI